MKSTGHAKPGKVRNYTDLDCRTSFDEHAILFRPAQRAAHQTESPMSDQPNHARAASRYAADYVLRWVEIANAVHGADLLYALVFTALWSGNYSHVRDGGHAAPEDLSPDRQPRPLTVRQVADSLALPYETVRRRFLEMIEKGAVQRVGRRGFIVSRSALSSPEVAHGHQRTQSSLARFLKELKSIGVEAA
jgi:hypothetical protein